MLGLWLIYIQFVIVTSAWCSGSFIIMKCVLLSLVKFLVLKSILSDINIVTAVLLWLLCARHIFSHLLLSGCLWICISCWQHYWRLLFDIIKSGNLYILIRVFGQLIFIINPVRFTFAILIISMCLVCSSLPPLLPFFCVKYFLMCSFNSSPFSTNF